MPPPPPMFSMNTCCPSASESPMARTRPAVSEELPAANGTTMETGRVGQGCGDAAVMVEMSARGESAVRAKMIRCPMHLWVADDKQTSGHGVRRRLHLPAGA